MNRQFAELNSKMDNNTINVNQRFAVNERFVRAEANMELTKSVNERITILKDDTCEDIDTNWLSKKRISGCSNSN